MNTKLLSLYGLKYNPFSQEVPIGALLPTPKLESLLWRIENLQVREGGFALVMGEPGSGKSAALRLVATLCPSDKAQNADGRRRRLASVGNDDEGDGAVPVGPEPEPVEIAPLLRKQMADYSATGLPPAYLPDHRGGRDEDQNDDSGCNPDDEENDG